jgi:5'-3' exonuclease
MIIDGNSLGYAAASLRPLSVDGQNVQAIFHALKMIKTAVSRFGEEYVTPIVLWDGNQYWRKDIFPEYKHKDSKNEDQIRIALDYKEQRPQLIRAIMMLGITQIIGKRYEADDIAGYMAKFYAAKGCKVLLVTGDKDWLQLVSQNVKWFDPIRDRDCIKSTFNTFTSFRTPEEFLEGKALIGDAGDNISGIDGIGKKCAPLIMQEFGSVQGLLDDFKTHGEFDKKKGTLPESLGRYKKKLNTFCADKALHEKFALNIKLMDLLNVKLSMAELKTVRSKADIPRFNAFCEDLVFRTFILQMSSWERLFATKTGK